CFLSCAVSRNSNILGFHVYIPVLCWGCHGYMRQSQESAGIILGFRPCLDTAYTFAKLCFRPQLWSCWENAKDEFNVVEIVPAKDSKQSTPVHIATLKLSVLPMVTGLDLTPPVTFRLKSGCGPVYLAGQHVSVSSCWNEDESGEEEESSSKEDDELEDLSREKSPVKPVQQPTKKRALSKKKEQEPPSQEPVVVKLHL
uniref:Nucleoplasmin core domain-containing protein n=1 Tax=Salvator merianae TaxID=96440 RepID=A0A8D0BPT0_SALMN